MNNVQAALIAAASRGGPHGDVTARAGHYLTWLNKNSETAEASQSQAERGRVRKSGEDPSSERVNLRVDLNAAPPTGSMGPKTVEAFHSQYSIRISPPVSPFIRHVVL